MNTRFRPTIMKNKRMHLGHAWIAWLNDNLARSTGGHFVLQLDDWLGGMCSSMHPGYGQGPDHCKYKIEEWGRLYIEDMEWMGLTPHHVTWSSRNADAHGSYAKSICLQRPNNSARGGAIPRAVRQPSPPHLHLDLYHPYHQVAVVVDDFLDGIEGFFRGMDLVSQSVCYDMLTAIFQFPTVMQNYLPLVMPRGAMEKDMELTGLGDYGPWAGKQWTSEHPPPYVHEYRESGWSPNDIVAGLHVMYGLMRELGQREMYYGPTMIPEATQRRPQP